MWARASAPATSASPMSLIAGWLKSFAHPMLGFSRVFSSIGRACVALDVTDPISACAAAETVRSRFGRLDALINNAGISHRPGADFAGQLPRSADVNHVRYVFETNVFGVIAV